MCLLKALLKTGSFDECNSMHGIGRTNLKRHQLKYNKDLRIEVHVALGSTGWGYYSASIFFFSQDTQSGPLEGTGWSAVTVVFELESP